MKPKISVICILLIFTAVLMSGCLPKAKIPGEKEIPRVFFSIGERDGVSYGYNIVYDGDYSTLTFDEQQELVTTELVEIKKHSSAVMYKTNGIVEFTMLENYNKSGDYLYFSSNPSFGEYELYAYNRESGLFKKIISSPASSMIIPDGDFEHGWVVTETVLTAIDLDKGKIDENACASFEAGEYFFYENGPDFYKKISRLSPMSDGTSIIINIEYYENEGDTYPVKSYFYQYDVVNARPFGPFNVPETTE